MSCGADPAPSWSPICSTPLSVSISQMRSYPIWMVRQVSKSGQPLADLHLCPYSVPRMTPCVICLLRTAVALPVKILTPLSLLRCEWFWSMCLFAIVPDVCHSTNTPPVLFVLSTCSCPPPFPLDDLCPLGRPLLV